MDSIISEGAQPNIITNLCESFSPIFEPYYEDATKYIIESSKNLNIIAESMGIEMDKKIIGKDILITEDARKVIIREGYDTFVIKPEEYLTNEITSYMGNFNLSEKFKFDRDNNNGNYKYKSNGNITGKGLAQPEKLIKGKNEDKNYFNVKKETNLHDIAAGRTSAAEFGKDAKRTVERKLSKDLAYYGTDSPLREKDKEANAAELAKHIKISDKKKKKNIDDFSFDDDSSSKVKTSYDNADKIYNNHKNHSKDGNTNLSNNTESKAKPEQPKQVEVATKGNGALEKIKQFGKDHKKELAIAGALAGTAAAAGIGYHLYKKHKAKKAKEEAEKQNKSESFSVFVFDEEAYITENTMDMLLEACDYELSESEILDNIEYELNEGFFANLKAKLAEAVEYLEDVEFDDEYIYFSESDMEFLVDATDGVLSEDEILSEIKLSWNTLNALAQKQRDKAQQKENEIIEKYKEMIKNNPDKSDEAWAWRKQEMKKIADNETKHGKRRKKYVNRLKAEGAAKKLAADQQKIGNKRIENRVQQPNGDEIVTNIKKYEEKKPEVHAAPKPEAPNPAVEKPKGPMIDKTKQVEVAKKGSSAMDKIRQFGKDHKKGLKIAGAIAGTAALAGGAYYLHKKYKEKKAKEQENQNKSESFNVFVFDEEAYITESTMDFLLEACDYELSEEEILDNISESLLSEINVSTETLKKLDQRTKERYDKTNKDINDAVGKLVGNKEGQLVFGQDTELDKLQQKKADNHKRFVRQINRHNKYDEKNYQNKLKDNNESLEKDIKNIDSETKAKVAKQGSGALEKIKQFGKDHKKELAIAGALAGTAAAAGVGYHLYKKHKAKKAKEEAEKQNKSESFSVFIFDETAYITENTMDMLLEACDYELSEDEILDNIEYELNEGMTKEQAEAYARALSGFTKEEEEKVTKARQKILNKAESSKSGKGSLAASSLLGLGGAFAGKENKNRRIAAGAILGAAALGAAGYGAKKLLDKRKAKKEADAKAENLKECMIDLLIEEDCVCISDDDMQFLLEACDYELSEEEILDNIAGELNGQ